MPGDIEIVRYTEAGPSFQMYGIGRTGFDPRTLEEIKDYKETLPTLNGRPQTADFARLAADLFEEQGLPAESARLGSALAP